MRVPLPVLVNHHYRLALLALTVTVRPNPAPLLHHPIREPTIDPLSTSSQTHRLLQSARCH